MVAQNRIFFAAINDEKMELNSIRNVMETELVKSISIRENWFFHNWVIALNHIHMLVEIKKGGVKLEMNFRYLCNQTGNPCYQFIS
jgi:REP element-mobilizing transposase RayT